MITLLGLSSFGFEMPRIERYVGKRVFRILRGNQIVRFGIRVTKGQLTLASAISLSNASLAHFKFIAGSGKSSHEILM